jgi:hypothetical protein
VDPRDPTKAKRRWTATASAVLAAIGINIAAVGTITGGHDQVEPARMEELAREQAAFGARLQRIEEAHADHGPHLPDALCVCVTKARAEAEFCEVSERWTRWRCASAK